MSPDNVEFCLVVERGPLEAQALLLCESIRRFCGAYRDCRITAVSPRPAWRPADAVRDRLLALGVDYRPEEIASPTPEYGPSYRVLAAGLVARAARAEVLVQLDTDTVFVGEPDLAIGGDLILARPVDEVGMCSRGAGDPRDAFWQAACRANGVDPDALGTVVTSIEGIGVRSSYNAGLIAARRALFVETQAAFERIVAADLRPWPRRGGGMRAGAGRVSDAGQTWWGTSQAAIAIAAARLGGSRRLLDAGHNVPLHLARRIPRSPPRVAHIHYHWLFDRKQEAEEALGLCLPRDSGAARWFAERLPLPLRAIEGPGLFSPRPMRFAAAAKPGPRCSVVMPVYRDAGWLDAAVASVLAQDFRDFELIVVDDGSPDPVPAAALAARDPRVRTIRLEENLGTADALNRGIAAARGPILARLDADDVAEPAWLDRMVAALDADAELGLVGSAVTLVDAEGAPIGVQPMPESDFAIRFTMLFHNPFYHPTAVYRRALFEAAGGYRPGLRLSEDRYLWFDMLKLGRARNLAEPLVRYRVNPAGLTRSHTDDDPRRRTAAIREALWREIGIVPPLARGAVADEADRLLRGHRPVDRAARAEAREIVAAALDRVEALTGDFARPAEGVATIAYAAALRARLAADDPTPRLRRALARAARLPILGAALRRGRRQLRRRARPARFPAP